MGCRRVSEGLRKAYLRRCLKDALEDVPSFTVACFLQQLSGCVGAWGGDGLGGMLSRSPLLSLGNRAGGPI